MRITDCAFNLNHAQGNIYTQEFKTYRSKDDELHIDRCIVNNQNSANQCCNPHTGKDIPSEFTFDQKGLFRH